jgi:hypothetical protein
MKQITCKRVITTALLAAALAAPSFSGLHATGATTPVEATSSANRDLIGTWEVRVSIHDCDSQVEQRSFPALLTFGAQGTLTESTTGFPPAVRGPGHGSWRMIDKDTYFAVLKAFRFDSAGIWIGVQTITQTIKLYENGAFTSNASIQFTDTAGNLVTSGCATSAGVRME